MIQRYSSRGGSLRRDFLAAHLPGAVRYDRIAGYFSSSLLEVAGEEVDACEGPIRLVCNSDLTPVDVETARAAAYGLRREWCRSQPELRASTPTGRSRFQRLYDLLKSRKLEVRVLPNTAFGLIHGKAGVIWPSTGDPIAFMGSANETGPGWEHNYELIWADPSADAVEWVSREFEALWHDPRAVELCDFVLDDAARLARRVVLPGLDAWKQEPEPAAAVVERPVYRQEIGLWEHQKYFVQLAFEAHRDRGGARFVLADQVGLGKTIQLALAAMLMALQGSDPVLILPPRTLLQQWQDEMWNLLAMPSARWTPQGWVDEHGVLHPVSGPEGIRRCPRRLGLVSQGLITSRSEICDHLSSLRYECVIVDEAHRARRKNLAERRQGEKAVPNNLMRFVGELGSRTRSLLLATATPVQLLPIEAWDLLSLLGVDYDGIVGNTYSQWRKDPVRAIALTIGTERMPEAMPEVWAYVRNPVPPAAEERVFAAVRRALDMKDTEWVASPEDLERLRPPDQQRLRQTADRLALDHNPFVRHIVRRTREYLENAFDPQTHEPYLRPIRVELLGEDDSSSLRLPTYLHDAYDCAEEFCRLLGQRVKGAGFLKTLLLRRVGSSIRAGELTARKMLDNWGETLVAEEEDDDSDMDAEVPSELKALTTEERGVLARFLAQLEANRERDPKVDRVLYCLRELGWLESGCIVFSQYYDSIEWLSSQLAAELPGEPIAIYAGGGRSSVMADGQTRRASRDDIKASVQRGEIRLLLGTDAASEGLNLQRLGTLINLDLPWNPTRLEQRKGRIQRIGQIRDTVQIYNMRYRDSVEDRVHQLLSARLAAIHQLFGQIPDVLEDVWIQVALGEIEAARQQLDAAPKQHPFDLKYRDVKPVPWETCARVLDTASANEALRRGWASRD